MTSARLLDFHYDTYHRRVGRFMEVDAAHAICPDCPTTKELASHTALKQQKKADTGLPSSRLSARAAAAAVAKVPSLGPIGEADGGTTGSQTSLGNKERSADMGRRLGNKAGSSNNDWKRGNPSIQDNSPLFSSTGAAFAFEADAGGERKGAKKKRSVAGGHETIGRAATIADLDECSGGKGGTLQWLKDRLSSTIAANNRLDDGRGVMDWEGMD